MATFASPGRIVAREAGVGRLEESNTSGAGSGVVIRKIARARNDSLRTFFLCFFFHIIFKFKFTRSSEVV